MSFFEKLTDGLRLYEAILLVLGALMFIALIVILIIYASQRRELKPLFMFFAVPVLMLVWPSVQKIKIDKTGADIATINEQVKNNPEDSASKKALADAVDKLEGRHVKDPEVVKRIAEAHFLLGENKAALETIQTLPPATQSDPEVKDIKTSVIISQQLQDQISVVQANPVDSNEVKQLNSLQIKAEALPIKNETVTDNIKIADQKVTEYKRINPRVKMTTTYNQ